MAQRGPGVVFSRQAWEDYQSWVKEDPKVAQRIARLIADCLRDPKSGMGNPEPLKYELSGYWSRRITQEHRLVYRLENDTCTVVQCRYHY